MSAFLSDEWIEAAREIRGRYDGQLPEFAAEVRLNQVITDVPFGDDTVSTYIDTSTGSLQLEFGELEDADAVITTDYETAKAMLVGEDPAIVMQAFMAGKIKVQGDMMKLMALQTSMPASETSEQMAAEIRAITD